MIVIIVSIVIFLVVVCLLVKESKSQCFGVL